MKMLTEDEAYKILEENPKLQEAADILLDANVPMDQVAVYVAVWIDKEEENPVKRAKWIVHLREAIRSGERP